MEFFKEKIMQFILSMLQPGLLHGFVNGVLEMIIGLIESVKARILTTPNKIDDMALPMLENLQSIFEGFLDPADDSTPTIAPPSEPVIEDPYTDPDG